jgi:hypothetical protein
MTVRTRLTVQISLFWGATEIHDKRAIPLTHVNVDNTKVRVDIGPAMGAVPFAFLLFGLVFRFFLVSDISVLFFFIFLVKLLLQSLPLMFIALSFLFL